MFDNRDLDGFVWWALNKLHSDQGPLTQNTITVIESHRYRVITGTAKSLQNRFNEMSMDVIIHGLAIPDDWVIHGLIYVGLSPTGKVTSNSFTPHGFKLAKWQGSEHLRELAMELKLQGILKGKYA